MPDDPSLARAKSIPSQSDQPLGERPRVARVAPSARREAARPKGRPFPGRDDGGRSPLGRHDAGELADWARSGRSTHGVDDRLDDMLDAQLLHVAIGASYGLDVQRGLAAAEIAATLAPAACAPCDGGQFQAKAAGLRSSATRESSTGLLAAMLGAALCHDARRLASVEVALDAARRRVPRALVADRN